MRDDGVYSQLPSDCHVIWSIIEIVGILVIEKGSIILALLLLKSLLKFILEPWLNSRLLHLLWLLLSIKIIKVILIAEIHF